jgi:hypothetical protein
VTTAERRIRNLEIRRLRRAGVRVYAIAAQFDLATDSVYRILSGWKGRCVSVSGRMRVRIDEAAEARGTTAGRLVAEACRDELAKGARLLEERRMVRK